jgi:hypothetical protein
MTRAKFVSEYQTNSLKDENNLYQQGEDVMKHNAMLHYLEYGILWSFKTCPTIQLASSSVIQSYWTIQMESNHICQFNNKYGCTDRSFAKASISVSLFFHNEFHPLKQKYN